MKRLILFLVLSATVASVATLADVPYPACTGADCNPQCGQNCAPPGVPCPQAGPPWCETCNGHGCTITW